MSEPMRFDVTGAPRAAIPAVGDVFPAKGGTPTRFWMVVAISATGGTHLLGLDETGAVVSTASYAAHVMRERPPLGHCPEISEWCPKIIWEKGA